MGTVTKARIIKIGNSQGIRIPKVLLDQAKLGEEVELEVHDGKLIVHPARGARHGWDDQFTKMAKRGDDRLLDAENTGLSSWDTDEWEW